MQAQTSYPQDVVEFGLFDHIAEYLEYEEFQGKLCLSALNFGIFAITVL